MADTTLGEIMSGDASIEQQVKASIIERLALDIEPGDVDDDAPIFASLAAGTEHEEQSINLDSIDILEVVLALNDGFGVEIPDDQPEIFTSIRTLAEFVRTAQTAA